MASNNVLVYLGYEDEAITEKYKGKVNFQTNKFGGKPDFPPNFKIDNSVCPLCQLPRPLLLQISAPLESDYHRTLYIFACINPKCWNQNESWSCIRVQTLDPSHIEAASSLTPVFKVPDWCQDADNWGDEESNANVNEENGNLIGAEKVSDEDDESCSFEDGLQVSFGNMSVDDRNANTGGLSEAQGGAVGRLHSPSATAEIEGNEGEIIYVDTPTHPQNDIVALLQEVAPLSQELCQKIESEKAGSIQFHPYFITVYDETSSPNSSDHHVNQLLQEYQQNNEDSNFLREKNTISGLGDDNPTVEKYEKGAPVHGDKMFHHFISRIQMNPGQILRYSRGSTSPLLLYPLQEIPKKCSHCQGEMTFELQILPTLISKLHLSSDAKQATRLEYGNVLIFTCSKSCWITGADVRQEAVLVQKEIY